MKCEPTRLNASLFAVNVSMRGFSFAVIVSQKMRQMRARPVLNASRYTYGGLDRGFLFEKLLAVKSLSTDEVGHETLKII